MIVAMTVSAGGVILFGLSILEDRLLNQAGQNLRWAAMEIAEKLDLVLLERYGATQILADSLSMVRDEPEGHQWTEYLQKIQKVHPVYGWIGLLDETGRVVAATDIDTVGKNAGGIGLAGQMKEETVVMVQDARPFDLVSEDKAVSFFAPVTIRPNSRRSSSFRGTVVTQIKLSELNMIVARILQEFATRRDITKDLEYQVINRHGEIIAESLKQQGSPVNLVNLGARSAWLATQGQAGFVMENHARRLVRVLTGYAPMPTRKELKELGWAILVRMDSDTALVPIRSTVRTVVTWGMGIILPLWLILFWVMNRLQAEWRLAEAARHALQESQALLRSILDRAPHAHILMDREGLVVSWNPMAEAIFGWPSEEVVGRPLEDLIVPYGNREIYEQGLRNVGGTEKGLLLNGRFETEGWHKEGYSVPIELSGSPIVNAEGLLFSVFVQDITQRKQAERRRSVELHISQLLLKATSLDSVAQDVLKTVCDLLGWKVGVLWKVDEQAQVLRYVTEYKASWASGNAFLEQTRCSNFRRGTGLPGRVWESGNVEWISDVTCDNNFPRASLAAVDGLHAAVAFPISMGGDVQAVMEFFSDAIQPPDRQLLNLFEWVRVEILLFLVRYEAVRQLKVSEARFSGILHMAEDAIVTVDDSQHIMLFNQGAERMFGYAVDEVLGLPFSLLLPHGFPGMDHSVREVASGCTTAKFFNERNEITGRRKSGEEFPAEASIAKVTVEGQTTYTAILRDVSRRKREEEVLKKAKAAAEQAAFQKAAILSAVEVFLIEISEEGVVREWTGQAEKLLGISSHDAIGRPFQSLSIDWNWETVQEAVTRSIGTMKTVCLDKVRLMMHGDRQRFLKLTASPLGVESGTGAILMGEDITERLDVERELVQAQKLESIGQLAAGIAHEINTPTQFVWDNVRFFSDAFGDLLAVLARQREVMESAKMGAWAPELIEACEAEVRRADLDYLQDEIPKALAQTTEGVERIATIVRAMKEFAHPDCDEMTNEDLNRAIVNTVTVARNEWKYVADVTMDLTSDLPPVPCRLGQFNQVILNIIVNAAHAIGDVVGNTGRKGVISIMSRRVDDDAEIRITDTGTGIPENIRHKIFDPFFTTKEVGKGTGQGLAIAHSVVVDKHHGSIRVESEVGKGTTFVIRLPLSRGGQAGEMEQAA